MRVTFRARFRGRINKLFPVGYTFPHPPIETIEIFRRVDKWLARVGKNEIVQLGNEPSHGAMKDAVAANFMLQLSEWEMRDAKGPLDPARVEEDPKGNFTLKSDTHIAADSQAGITERNVYKAECGALVKVTEIKSKLLKVPPTCLACRAVWDRLKGKVSA
jgi:hypothetical protein